jgi:hypothetical protein
VLPCGDAQVIIVVTEARAITRTRVSRSVVI